jgi:hypothetical protein
LLHTKQTLEGVRTFAELQCHPRTVVFCPLEGLHETIPSAQNFRVQAVVTVATGDPTGTAAEAIDWLHNKANINIYNRHEQNKRLRNLLRRHLIVRSDEQRKGPRKKQPWNTVISLLSTYACQILMIKELMRNAVKHVEIILIMFLVHQLNQQ